MSRFTVTVQATRPANKNPECFYCNQPIGEKHRDDCVLVKRMVRIRAIAEYEVEVPASWTPAMIEYYRNEGGFPAENIIGELIDLEQDQEDFSKIVKFEFVENASGKYLDEVER